ncbi:MAG: hypothetical protein K1X83_05705 [Oligoflexia bacterium]|nr:hypothetical protein [Oligoflexia bacterium]
MSKPEGKKRNQDSHKVLQFDPALRTRRAVTKLPNEMQERVTFWKDEIEALREERFASIEQALQTLIARVTARLEDGSKGSDGEREFLYDLLSTDPGVVEYLKSVLKID